jgi:putative membrane protein
LLATGVALEALEIPRDVGVRNAAVAVSIGLGLSGIGQAWIGWMRTERALRENRPLPGPTLGGVVAVGVLIIGALITFGLVR